MPPAMPSEVFNGVLPSGNVSDFCWNMLGSSHKIYLRTCAC
jgi:hypothetical protein